MKLTKALLDVFQQHIDWDTLPLTFQDTLKLCRGLGLEYLWIDALCIIQDDDTDWRREASRMASVYLQSFVTFAASKSQNACEGLYSLANPSQHQGQPGFAVLSPGPSFRSTADVVRLRTFDMSASDGSLHKVYVRKGSNHRLERLPLNSRGWAFQERRLSPRVVYFGDEELIWECMGTTMCDCGFAPPPDRALSKAQRMGVIANSCAPLRWYDIVIHYVRLNFTFQEDIFPALQGLARHMQEERQCEYFAGLWGDTLLQDLLWRVVSANKARKEQPYLAPTWSWASVSGKLQWFTSLKRVFDQFQPQAQVVSIKTESVGADPLGALNGGRLCIQGRCIETYSASRHEDTVQAIGPHSPNGTVEGPFEQMTPLGFQHGLYLADNGCHTTRTYWQEGYSIILIGLSHRKRAHGLALKQRYPHGPYERVGYCMWTDWPQSAEFFERHGTCRNLTIV